MKKSAKREGRVNLSPTSTFFSYSGFLFQDVLNQVVVIFFWRPTPQHAVEAFNAAETFSGPPSCRV
jgi:hypothetical protein